LFRQNIDKFFLELHIAHNEVEEKLFHWLKKFGFKHDIPMIPANDYHYVNKGELKYWNLIGGLRRNLTISNPDPITNDDFYIKSPQEIEERTIELAGKDDAKKIMTSFDTLDSLLVFDWKNRKVPKISFDNAEERLYKTLAKKMAAYFGGKDNVPDNYKLRMREEFEVAKFTGNCSYYLLVYDLIEWCRGKRIQTPVGRGSAASLLMLYMLGITKVDPIQYNLIAERCSNRQRLKESDVDLDFSKEDVERIKKQYLYPKYGKECVANICNYGIYKMSSSIRSVLRYLEIPVSQQNAINKALKDKFVEQSHLEDSDETIEPIISNIKKLPEFKSIFESNGINNYEEVLDYAEHLEGAVEKVSVHASGLLISNEPIYQRYPVVRIKDTICSAYDMADLSSINALKLDLLSVNTYDRIGKTLNMFNQHNEIKKVRKSAENLSTTDSKLILPDGLKVS
jgi:DNA polymerase-3 subunit alpha